MGTLLRKLVCTPVAFVLMLTTLLTPATADTPTVSSQAETTPEMPAGLMSAVLAASSQPSVAGGYSEQKVVAYGGANDNLGWSVALAGDTALVGAYRKDVGVLPDQGAAYVFVWSGTAWTLEQELIADDGGDGDQFGCSVALSADGDTAVVGAYTHDVELAEDQGAAYVFVRSGATWTQQGQLIADDGAEDDHFGGSVAVGENTVVVGAWYDDIGANVDQGSAYVFVWNGATWSQQAKLTATDGGAGDHLGASVALAGNTALVSGPGHDVGANDNQGAVYVFIREGSVWSEQAQLTAADGAAGDEFGSAVGLSGETALVGAWYDDVGANGNQGSAYVFVRSGTTWSQQAQLVAADGELGDWFGLAVAISGERALVGATSDDVGAKANQGSAYVFVRSGTTWSQQAQLMAADGAANDWLGRSVALDGETALAGAWGDDIGANGNQGSAYVFAGNGGTWDQQAKLIGSDGEAEDHFGWSVAVDGDTALVGAYADDVAAGDQGSVYVMVRSGSTWGLQQKLTAGDGEIGDSFGYAVAVVGNTAAVGAPWNDIEDAMDQGAAYVFVRSGSTWTQQARLTAGDGEEYDWFGASVAVDGETVLVGAPRDDVGGYESGAAYVFTRSGTTWSQQAHLVVADVEPVQELGWSVSLDGETALVGAPYAWVEDSFGAAYVFVRSGSTWAEQATLLPAGAVVVGYFGWSVSLDGETALVGSPGDEVGANSSQGAAYVYVRSGTSWSQQQRLTAADGSDYDEFGIAVAVDGETALVGAWGADVGLHEDQGAAYIYARGGATWSPQGKLIASDGGPADGFGWSVSLAGDTALVGAPGDDIGVNEDQGSAYFYTVAAAASYEIYLPALLRNAP